MKSARPSIGGGSAQKRKRDRKSMGRRVSFAPDHQLHTMHLFEEEEVTPGTCYSLDRLQLLSCVSGPETMSQKACHAYAPADSRDKEAACCCPKQP